MLVRVSPPDTVSEGDKLPVSEAEEDMESDGVPVTLLLEDCDNVDTSEGVGDVDGVTVLEGDWLLVVAALFDIDCDKDCDGVTCWLPDAEALADWSWLGLCDGVTDAVAELV